MLKRIMSLFYLGVLVGAILLSPTVAMAKEHRVALVVGNAKYAGNPLRNPVNDAHAMAKALRELGFDVIEKTDVSQRDLNRAITQFRLKLTSNSVALFYYAGHGMQVRGNNYLIPVDAEISTEATIGSEAVNVDTVLQQLSEAGSRVNLVILDACRNNPYERRFRATGGGLASMDAPKGTLIAYATAPGKVAMDGEGANGLYTSELLRAIRKPGLQVEEVFKEVRIQVNRGSGDSQIPWESSSLTGQFFFSPPAAEAAPAESATAAATPAAPAMDPAAIEIETWRAAQQMDTEEGYRAYMQQYPRGRFIGLAKAGIAKLKQQEKALAATKAAQQAEERKAQQLAEKQAAERLAADRLAMAKAASTPGPAQKPATAPPLAVAPKIAPPGEKPISQEMSAYRPTRAPTCRSRDDEASFFKDEAVSVKISTKLQFAKGLMQEKIQVRVTGGVATLSGTVSTEERAMMAGKLTAEASGVACVNNLLRVGTPDDSQTNIFGGN